MRVVGVLAVVVAALIPLQALRSEPARLNLAADTEAQLAATIRQIEADAVADDPLRMGPRRDRDRIVRGAEHFFRPFPGGNGRSCATCHDPRDGFSLSPARAEARWQRLQRARRADPAADDPRFRAIDADDGRADFTQLRTRALIKVRVPLPAGVRLAGDRSATHVTVSRAVTRSTC